MIRELDNGTPIMQHPRRTAELIWLFAVVLWVIYGASAAQAQRPDGLDQPILATNRCGDGLPGEVHFTIAATGDTFPHENIQNMAEANGYDYLFDYLRPYLRAADLAYTNFDGAMLASSQRSGYPLFNFSPALAPALKNAGISLISSANNHILDRGPEGLNATLAVLDAAGIQQHGAVLSDAAERPAYLTIPLSSQGVTITVGFVAASWGTNGNPDPYNQVNLLYAGNEYGSQGAVRQSVLDAVAQAAAATDIVIVAAHWGFEYQFYPHPSQLEAARALAAAGADIILGAQSHTLQPVELISSGGRTTLVAYSLANFLASQGAFQSQFYSATSVIFYVGLARAADGSVRLTGYRYLPTIHVDGDTRPAPILENTLPEVEAHVQLIMRDPGAARRLPAIPPAEGTRVEVCPTLTLAEAPDAPIGGDFAQHYATLGDGVTARPLSEAIAVFGLPLGPPVRELSEDCGTTLSVLYSERQRLELRGSQDWPYRVVGAQIGAAVYEQRYGAAPARRSELAAPDTFADQRFRSFYERYGGLNIFGYPLSGPLQEDGRMVQYFERSRFELTTDGAVQLGLLSAEYAGIAAQCGLAAGPTAAATQAGTSRAKPVEALTPAPSAAPVAPAPAASWRLEPLIGGLLLVSIALVALLIWAGWAALARRGSGQRRPRASARQRVAARRQARDDNALLSRLLDE